MLNDADQETIRRWLDEDLGRFGWFRQKVGAVWHNKIPKRFRLFGLTHGLLKSVLIVSAPAASFFYGAVSLASAAWVGGALLGLNAASAIADGLSKVKASSDYQSEALIRFGDLLTTLKRDAVKGQERDMAISACLGIIENSCLPLTKSRKGDISVTLILYQGASTTKLRVSKRNPGNERPTNREIDAERLLGHYACQHSATPRVVSDLQLFGKTFSVSPTQNRVNYRSILIVPLEAPRRGESAIRGFVSIDHKRPYAFHGNLANVIVVTCEPIINQLRELLGGA